MSEGASFAIKSAVVHLRTAASHLEVACAIDQQVADMINRVHGQEDLDWIANELEQLIKETVP